jgi:Ohr subfamily peroxiredoxin
MAHWQILHDVSGHRGRRSTQVTVMPVDVKYTTETIASGGRGGRSRTMDGALDVSLSRPKEFGGAGGPGTNPEQLFAAGYAACFLSALSFVAGQDKVRIPQDATGTAKVGIGPRSEGGFGITAALLVSLPGIERPVAEALVQRAHQLCPYSNATRCADLQRGRMRHVHAHLRQAA